MLRPNSMPDPDKALLEHLPMVRCLAQKIHRRLPRSVEIDDLFSAGLVGLMEAHAKFDPAKKIKFASFASFRVRGAILDSLRISDWAPRELRQRGRMVQEAIRALTSRLGHAPSEEEVAAELQIGLQAYQQLLGDLHGLEIGTLHRMHEDGSGEEELVYVQGRREDDPLYRCLQGEMVARLTEAIENLPERERRVMALYYHEELTRSEIGQVLGITEARVQQIRASAVFHLRSAFTGSRLTPARRKTQDCKTPGGIPCTPAYSARAVA